MKEQHLRRALGQTRPVLWEAGEPAGDGARRFAGYTDTYLRVEVDAPAGVELENRIEPVLLSGLAGAPPDRLTGTRTDRLASPGSSPPG
jgi:hypothetical protein